MCLCACARVRVEFVSSNFSLKFVESARCYAGHFFHALYPLVS